MVRIYFMLSLSSLAHATFMLLDSLTCTRQPPHHTLHGHHHTLYGLTTPFMPPLQADFGTIREQVADMEHTNMANAQTHFTTKLVIGTDNYMPPEVRR
jgi:hypothetical protein